MPADARLKWLIGAAEHLSRRGSLTLQSAEQELGVKVRDMEVPGIMSSTE